MVDVSGTFGAAGTSATITPESVESADAGAGFNVSIFGTFVGTVQLERRFTSQGGTNWHFLTSNGTQIGRWTAPCSESFSEPQSGVEYRLNCIAWTSGSIAYRMGS